MVLLMPLLPMYAAPPPNDSFTNSIHLEGTNISGTGTVLEGTGEPGEPDHRYHTFFQMTGETAWWSWAAPFTGRAVIGNVNPFNHQVGVYTGPAVDRLQRVYRSSFNSSWSFKAQQGVVYHFAFERKVGGDPAVNFLLILTPFPTNSPNDNFADAYDSGAVSANVGATRELGEPAHRAGSSNKSLWWRHTVTFNSRVWIKDNDGILPDLTLAAYTGDTVQTLTLVAKRTNSLDFNGTGGVTYHIAAETPGEVNGDIQITGGSVLPDGRIVVEPGNLVQNSSFEDPIPAWETQGSASAHIAEPQFTVDGGNRLVFGWGTRISQTIATVPEHPYRVKLAVKRGGSQTNRVVIHFGQQVSPEFVLEPLSQSSWRWPEFTLVASSNTTLLVIESLGDVAEFDKITVVPLATPPQMVHQPQGAAAFEGGSATFVAGVTGAQPLHQQWLFNEHPLPGQNSFVLQVTNVTSANAGVYRLIATNLYGAVTSAPASLTLEQQTSPGIILQPEGGTVLAGDYVCLRVVAIGTPPLQYQWSKDGQPLALETNRNLVIPQFSETNAGSYRVVVASFAETVTSLPAQLSLAPPTTGGGQIYFANRQYLFGVTNNAPVFDFDGVMPLAGPDFLAQLYAGLTPESLRPVGQPQPFLHGFQAGYIATVLVTLPDILPGAQAYAQIRAWESAQGASYEEARAWGGRSGASAILPVTTTGGPSPGPTDGVLLGLESFNVTSGLPEYRRGRLQFVEARLDGTLVWELLGQAGARYLIERQADGTNWAPLQLLENPTDRSQFSDVPPDASIVLYRAQLLP
jgi:hypothetical protein